MTDKVKLLHLEIEKLHPQIKFDEEAAEQWFQVVKNHESRKEFFDQYGSNFNSEARQNVMNLTWDIHTGVYGTKLYKALK